MDEVIDPIEIQAIDSIESMIKQDDFQKFVLFKNHYKKYMEMSEMYEDVLLKLSNYEEDVLQMRITCCQLEQESRRVKCQLRDAENLLRDREDELFNTDEKITQLEYETEIERSLRLEAEDKLKQVEKEKDCVTDELISIKYEKNEMQLKCTVMQSKTTEEFESHTLERKRYKREIEAIKKERDFRHKQWLELYSKVKDLENQWKNSCELQHLLRLSIQHLATCNKNSCRMCVKVREAYSDCPGDAEGSSNNKRLAQWLRGKYHRMCRSVFTVYRGLVNLKNATHDPKLVGQSKPSFICYSETPSLESRSFRRSRSTKMRNSYRKNGSTPNLNLAVTSSHVNYEHSCSSGSDSTSDSGFGDHDMKPPCASTPKRPSQDEPDYHDPKDMSAIDVCEQSDDSLFKVMELIHQFEDDVTLCDDDFSQSFRHIDDDGNVGRQDTVPNQESVDPVSNEMDNTDDCQGGFHKGKRLGSFRKFINRVSKSDFFTPACIVGKPS